MARVFFAASCGFWALWLADLAAGDVGMVVVTIAVVVGGDLIFRFVMAKVADLLEVEPAASDHPAHLLLSELCDRNGIEAPHLHFTTGAGAPLGSFRQGATGAIILNERLYTHFPEEFFAALLARQVADTNMWSLLRQLQFHAITTFPTIVILAFAFLVPSQFPDGTVFNMFVSFVVPIFFLFLVHALMRWRVFLIDRHGARLMGDPMALARAFAKLERLHPVEMDRFLARRRWIPAMPRVYSPLPDMRERVYRLMRLSVRTG